MIESTSQYFIKPTVKYVYYIKSKCVNIYYKYKNSYFHLLSCTNFKIVAIALKNILQSPIKKGYIDINMSRLYYI